MRSLEIEGLFNLRIRSYQEMEEDETREEENEEQICGMVLTFNINS